MPEPRTTTATPPRPSGGLARRMMLRWAPVLIAALAAFAAPVLMSSGSTEAGPSDDTLILGADVYRSVCSSCHQPGGAGLAGQYPPLVENPNVDDAAYIEDVIRNGKTGEIVVGDETFDEVMPPQATLGDDEIVAVVAYIQSGFAAPAVAVPISDTGPVAGTELPALTDWTWIIAYVIAFGAAAFVLGPRVIKAQDRRTMPWLDAWLKTGVIVVGMVLATTIIPSKALELDTVRNWPRAAQDLIAIGLWSGGLVGGIWLLWYAHRERRI